MRRRGVMCLGSCFGLRFVDFSTEASLRPYVIHSYNHSPSWLLTVDTSVKVYFCDPQSPWQRGTNENTNGLLRQYFPKKTDLSVYSQADLNKVALRLNQRPRKTLGFETPASKLQASVASTG